MIDWKELYASSSYTTAEKYRRFENGPIGLIARYLFGVCYKSNCLLGSCIEDIKTGKTPPTGTATYFDNGNIDWFKPNEIGESKYLNASKNKITKVAIEQKKATIFKKDTLLLNCIGDIGRVSILKVNASSNQQITGINLTKEINPEYAYYYFLSSRMLFQIGQLETTLPIINQAKIRNIPFSKVSMDIQDNIISFLNYCLECLLKEELPVNNSFNLPANVYHVAKLIFLHHRFNKECLNIMKTNQNISILFVNQFYKKP